MKDIKRNFLKYTEKVVNKTDSLTQMAKLNIEIKKSLSEIEDSKTRIGDYIAGLYESGAESVSLNEKGIADDLQNINNLKAKMKQIKKTLEELKKKKAPEPDKKEKKDDDESKNKNV